MLYLIVTKDGKEMAFQKDYDTKLVTNRAGKTYYTEKYVGKDCDGDPMYYRDFGVVLPKGTIENWTGKNLSPNDNYIEFDEALSYTNHGSHRV